MDGLGLSTDFYIIVLLWIARVVLWTIVCTGLACLGIRVLDALTPHVHQRSKIGEDPISVGLFIAGYLVMIGLVIHGVVTGPVLIGAGIIQSIFDAGRLGLVAISFFISLLLGLVLLMIMDKLTPKIPFNSIEKNSVGIGIYTFGYLVFFGLIIHAALIMPL